MHDHAGLHNEAVISYVRTQSMKLSHSSVYQRGVEHIRHGLMRAHNLSSVVESGFSSLLYFLPIPAYSMHLPLPCKH